MKLRRTSHREFDRQHGFPAAPSRDSATSDFIEAVESRQRFFQRPEFGSGFRWGKGRNLELSTFRVLVVAKETFVFLTLAPSISWRFYRGESGILTPKIFSAAADFEKCGFRD